jgi:hypothetical protein
VHVSKKLDLVRLEQELSAAGVAVNGLILHGEETDGELLTFGPLDENGAAPTVDVPPEAAPIVDAHDASKPKRSAQFEQAEDVERLALVNERAQTDPAFAALADLSLRGKPS